MLGPFYPRAYQGTGKAGRVVAHFDIGPDGLPSNARVVSVTGGNAFGTAMTDWLQSGYVHFRPRFAAGQPITTPGKTFTVHFVPAP